MKNPRFVDGQVVGAGYPILESEGEEIEYRVVCRKPWWWVVNGRILEPGDPGAPKPQPIFNHRTASSLSLTAFS